MSKKLKDEIKAKSSLRQLQQGEISFSQYLRDLCDIQKEKILRGEL
jgi:uncharacterized protein YbcV (DUF1398 family)